MSTRSYGRYNELAFVVGALLGVLTFALGLAFLILALTVGVREGTYLTGTQDLALGLGGAVAGIVGLVLRAYSERVAGAVPVSVAGAVPERFRGPAVARLGGTAIFLVGLMAVLFALSAEVTVSAPFLATPKEKAVLFVTAFAFTIAGLVITRAAGRAVGW